MDFVERLNAMSAKVNQLASTIQTEEATKTAFVMPFIHTVLGYDVFDPSEVVPEYVCDVGTKKGEKIDYAILKGGQIQILIETKKVGEPLNINHASQLFRYFHVTTARISILTNGRIYRFYTDLDAPNKMDEKPFLEIDLLNMDEHVIPELQKLTKSAFDVESIINAAGELKYVGNIKKEMATQFSQPDVLDLVPQSSVKVDQVTVPRADLELDVEVELRTSPDARERVRDSFSACNCCCSILLGFLFGQLRFPDVFLITSAICAVKCGQSLLLRKCLCSW